MSGAYFTHSFVNSFFVHAKAISIHSSHLMYNSFKCTVSVYKFNVQMKRIIKFIYRTEVTAVLVITSI